MTTVPTELDAKIVARAHRSLDSLHALIYFAPEADEEFTAVGLRPGRMGYFASRSAPMGPVSAGVTAATFYNFNPALVARHIPRAWALAGVEQTSWPPGCAPPTGRCGACSATTVVAGPRSPRRPSSPAPPPSALRPHGRPLYAAHADLDWPTSRTSCCGTRSPCCASTAATGTSPRCSTPGCPASTRSSRTPPPGAVSPTAAAKATRGWSDEEWAAAVADLRDRGLLDDDGLTAAGQATRDSVEVATDRLAAAPWLALGAADVGPRSPSSGAVFRSGARRRPARSRAGCSPPAR